MLFKNLGFDSDVQVIDYSILSSETSAKPLYRSDVWLLQSGI